MRWGLFVLLGGITVFLGMRSLAGLGPVRKWVAIRVRLAVLLLLILILGDIKLVRNNTDVELMVVRDISQSTGLVTDFPGTFLQSSLDDYLPARPGSATARRGRIKIRWGKSALMSGRIIDAIPSRRFRWSASGARGGNGNRCGWGSATGFGVDGE